MEFKTIEWDREKLYEQIWATPLRTVAKEYGLSDTGLAKICKKLQIPRPGLGYWRRKECGYKVSRPTLPALKNPVSVTSRMPTTPPVKGEPIHAQFTAPLTIPRPTEAVYSLVKQTEHAYASGRADQFGRVIVSNWRLPHLDCRVTRLGLRRAVRFVDELVKLLEANQFRIRAVADRGSGILGIDADGEMIRIFLKEDVRGRKRELTSAEQRDREQWPAVKKRDFAYAYDATNRFVFEIENYSDSQRKWVDTKHRKVEDCTHQIVFGIRAAAAWEKRMRREREMRSRRQEEEQRLRRSEQLKLERLKSNIASWEEAQRIRAYLAAVRQHAETRPGGLAENGPTFRFLDWAGRHADRLDPADAPPGPEWDVEES